MNMCEHDVYDPVLSIFIKVKHKHYYVHTKGNEWYCIYCGKKVKSS